MRDSGVPVLIISTELDEVLALADRIAVMYGGRIVAVVPAGTPREKLGTAHGRSRRMTDQAPHAPTCLAKRTRGDARPSTR